MQQPLLRTFLHNRKKKFKSLRFCFWISKSHSFCLTKQLKSYTPSINSIHRQIYIQLFVIWSFLKNKVAQKKKKKTFRVIEDFVSLMGNEILLKYRGFAFPEWENNVSQLRPRGIYWITRCVSLMCSWQSPSPLTP